MIQLDGPFLLYCYLVALEPLDLVQVGFFNTHQFFLIAHLNILNPGDESLLSLFILGLKLRDDQFVAAMDFFDFNRVTRLHHFKLLYTLVQYFELCFARNERFRLALKLCTHDVEFLAELRAQRLFLYDHLMLVLGLKNSLLLF